MNKPREHWGTKLGLVLATAGSAVGLGSLWQFPYVTGQNGGGVFVLLYLAFSLFIGIPVFIAEVLLGRRAQRGPVGTFEDLSHHSPNWRLVGWLNVGACFLILSFYSVVAGWGMNYALLGLNSFMVGKSADQIRGVFDTLYQSGDIQILWHSLFMALNIGVVIGGVRKGIEHWNKILMPVLFVMLVGLFAYTVTLDGFMQALHFVFAPDFSKLSPNGVLSALGLSFFTLSVGLGILITYGSYMRPEDDIPRTAVQVAIMTTLVSLVAALVIFPIIFTFGFAPEGGPGLVFKTLPVLFAQLPGAMILSTVFFMLVVFTALTSSVSLLETVVANSIEIYDWSRRKAVVLCGLGAFVVGIPSALSGSGGMFTSWTSMYGRDFFGTMNFVASNWLLPLGGLFITIFAGWFLDPCVLKSEFMKGTGWGWLFQPWRFVIRWVAPVAIILVIMDQAGIINFNALMQSQSV
ncbi:MAG: sodium-dependent transporter [Chlamydiia bacterium]